MHGTSLLSTPDQFRPELLPWVSKTDDEEHCFLKFFGFSYIDSSIYKEEIGRSGNGMNRSNVLGFSASN